MDTKTKNRRKMTRRRIPLLAWYVCEGYKKNSYPVRKEGKNRISGHVGRWTKWTLR